jgi:hypothetical protein
VALNHAAGPYTTERLFFDRGLSYFDNEERTASEYQLTQILGPTLAGSLFLVYSTYRELANSGVSNRTEELGGLQLNWSLGPKTRLLLDAIADRQDYDGGPRVNNLIARAILNRTLTDTLTMQLLYEHQRADASRSGESFYENLVYFRVVKFFD